MNRISLISRDSQRGGDRFGWYLALIAVVLALIITALSRTAGDAAQKFWRENRPVVTAIIARFPQAGRRELCTDGLIDYFRNNPGFAPEWFRAACAPFIIDGRMAQGSIPSLH